jgi:thymidylate kinase
MSLLIIEGDNGSGKDTIAGLFENQGFFIPTYTKEARKKEQNAKILKGLERINAFLEYNQFCCALAMKHEKALIVRCWISTVAASYADDIFTLPEAIQKAHEIYNILPHHDFIICLKCNYKKRVARIQDRLAAGGSADDDISIERDKKYQQILGEIENFTPYWIQIEASDKTPEKIFAQIQDNIKVFL